ncbi:MAG: protein phosphatase 2C domain-containing protein [Ktedonobacteraceae bacterium]|nr:protein phosphatase 2C domain-containing protein [Ktedonobacteraceae bacterium]
MSAYHLTAVMQKYISWRAALLALLCAPLYLSLLSSPSAFAFSTGEPLPAPPSEDITRAGVSVVRILASYAEMPSPTPTLQCTGLGVLVKSWAPTNAIDQNAWVLTDSTVVNPGSGALCSSQHAQGKLTAVSVYLSTAYHPQALSVAISNPALSTVRCVLTPCDHQLVLISFHAPVAYPSVDLADSAVPQGRGIALTDMLQPLNALNAAETDSRQFAAYLKNVQASLTPTPVTTALVQTEPGMPVVDGHGLLQALHLANGATADMQTIKSLLSQSQELSNPPGNPVHDGWNAGIEQYYQGNRQAAHAFFLQAAQQNQEFAAARLLADQTAPPPAVSAENGKTSIDGVLIPNLLLALTGVVVLILLFVFVHSYLHRRKLKAEYVEAQHMAEMAVQRMKESQALQNSQMMQQAPQGAFPPEARTLVPPSIRCARCGTVVQAGARFCPHCDLSLVPSDSGKYPRVVPQPLAPVTNTRSLAEQPTVEMSPSGQKNTLSPSDTSLSHTLKQLHGRRLGFIVGTCSDAGIKRKHKPNEDSLFAAQGVRATGYSLQQVGLFVVADGMGGHANGQDASRLAIQTFINSVLPKMAKNGEISPDEATLLLVEGVQQANVAVYTHNVQHGADMGTTMTAVLILDSTAYVANVGDSRTYLYSESEPEGHRLAKITQDHSVVASLVDAGIIQPDDIYTHPKRNQIYRSLGEKQVVEVDSFVEHLQLGNKLLLCSDGLWDMVRDPQIENVLHINSLDPAMTGAALVQSALDGGGEDNVSVIVVQMTEAAKPVTMPGIQLLTKPDDVQMPQV